MKLSPKILRVSLFITLIVGVAGATYFQQTDNLRGQVTNFEECVYSIDKTAGESCLGGDMEMCSNSSDCYCYNEAATCACNDAGTEIGYCGAGACVDCSPAGICCKDGAPRLTNQATCGFLGGDWRQGTDTSFCGGNTNSNSSSSAGNNCQPGETYCATSMQIMCDCNGVATGYGCAAGTCFSCPVCSSSAASTISSTFSQTNSQVGRCPPPGPQQVRGSCDGGFPGTCQFVNNTTVGITGYFASCEIQGCQYYAPCTPGGNCGTNDQGYPLKECSPGESVVISCNEDGGYTYEEICPENGCIDDHACNGGGNCTSDSECGEQVCGTCENGEKLCDVPFCKDGTCSGRTEVQSCDDGGACTQDSNCGTEPICGECSDGEKECWVPVCQNNDCTKIREIQQCNPGDQCTVDSDCGTKQCEQCLNGTQECLVPVCDGGSCIETTESQNCNVGDECTQDSDCGAEQCTPCVDGEQQCAVPDCALGVCTEIYINRTCSGDNSGDNSGDPPPPPPPDNGGNTAGDDGGDPPPDNCPEGKEACTPEENLVYTCPDGTILFPTCPQDGCVDLDADCPEVRPGICCENKQCALGVCANPYDSMGSCEAVCDPLPPVSSAPSSGSSSSSSSVAGVQYCCNNNMCTLENCDSGGFGNLQDCRDSCETTQPDPPLNCEQNVYVKVDYYKRDSSNPDYQLEDAIYIGGPGDNYDTRGEDYDGPLVSIDSGEWVRLLNISNYRPTYHVFALSLSRRGEQPQILVKLRPQAQGWSPNEADVYGESVTLYGSLQMSGATITDIYSADGIWYAPEKGFDGIIDEPDNDEIWVASGSGALQFALHDTNVHNGDGRSDHFYIKYDYLPTCPPSPPGEDDGGGGGTDDGGDPPEPPTSSVSSVASKTSSSFSVGIIGGDDGGDPPPPDEDDDGYNPPPPPDDDDEGTGGGTTGGVVFPAVCGNGTVEAGEECDDGNFFNGDGCSNTCTIELTLISSSQCGNGILEAGEECDDGNLSNDDTCSDECTHKSLSARCGNGVRDPLEQCDDGNYTRNDGCSPFCRLETGDPNVVASDTSVQTLVAAGSVCGNGILEFGEECDDGNARGEDGCSERCQAEVGVCGDGIVQALRGEQCESALHDPILPYACVQCQFVSPTCGNGTVEAGEECDDGNQNSNDPDSNCRENCRFGHCGDGITDSTEECDDGNRVSGDGCNAACLEERQPQSAPEPKPTSVLGLQQDSMNNPPSLLGMIQSQQTATQQQPQQYPLAQLQPLIQQRAPIGDTGPAAVAVIGAGAAAGMSWMRKKKRK